MTIYPLDSVRNAALERRLDPLLESVRTDVAAIPPEDVQHLGEITDVLSAFDASRPRLNVIASMLSDLQGQSGADISTGLGFVPIVLRRLGLTVIATEHDLQAGLLARPGGEILQYSIGSSPPPIAADSLEFLVFSEVLEHLNQSPVRVLNELASLLKEGGRFILTTPNVARLQHIELLAAGENFLEPFDEGVPAGRPATDFIEHVREYSVREVVEAVEAAGLGVDEVVMTGWGDGDYEPLSNPYANEIIVLRATR